MWWQFLIDNPQSKMEDCSCWTMMGYSSQMTMLEDKSSLDIVYEFLVPEDCRYAIQVEVPTVNKNVDKLLKNTANWFKRAN